MSEDKKKGFSFLEEAAAMMNEKQCGSTIATVDGVNFFKVGEGKKKKPYTVKKG